MLHLVGYVFSADGKLVRDDEIHLRFRHLIQQIVGERDRVSRSAKAFGHSALRRNQIKFAAVGLQAACNGERDIAQIAESARAAAFRAILPVFLCEKFYEQCLRRKGILRPGTLRSRRKSVLR